MLITAEVIQFNNIGITPGIGVSELSSQIFERYAGFYHFGIENDEIKCGLVPHSKLVSILIASRKASAGSILVCWGKETKALVSRVKSSTNSNDSSKQKSNTAYNTT